MASEDGRTKNERNNENNANNIRNAADVAIATKNPYAVAAGTAIKTADKITGGKSTQALGKSMTMANKISPGGRKIQRKSNKLNESGMSDKIGRVAAAKNQMSGGKGGDGAKGKAPSDAASRLNKKQPNKNNNIEDDDRKVDTKRIKLFFSIITKVLFLIILLAPIFLMLLIFVVFIAVISLDDSSGSGSAVATGGYFSSECDEVTVIFTDKSKGYEVTGSNTYSIDDYVAGVLEGEVGEFNNIEVYKEYAIAARTYFTVNQNACSIESSDRKQVFKETSNALMKQAAEETKDQVILDKDGRLINTEYDAFCSIGKDSNYYTIKQKNQKIPVSWVDSHPGIIAKWKQGNCAGNHGRGSSQWGSYYLATEKGYNYKQLIAYYYESDDEDESISISQPSFVSSIPGLSIKETKTASYTLNQPIESFLSSKGSSLVDYNNYIKESVTNAGAGTREGVVTAAVSMINYLYDKYDTKLPYYWDGSYQGVGLPDSLGKNIPSEPSEPSHTVYYYKSFDCSGFVSWAIRNGGYNFNRETASSMITKFGSDSCNIENSSCKGEIGDLIASSGHVKMIVSVDETNSRYYIAESTTNGVIVQTHGMHSPNQRTVETKILKMGKFYEDASNVDSSY